MRLVIGSFTAAAALAALSFSPALHAQDFKVFDRTVQAHGFLQQGYAYSNENNFLTMDTTSGSFKMTDAGVNLSTSLSDKFRLGAQVYDRNIGILGDYHPQLDWAYGDYKIKPWLGFRGGKVKTALGLLNDTQDAEFLYTWALLPQSLYPLDLRSNTIAHTGGDVYGRIRLQKAGSLSYTGYYGQRANDTRGGEYYGAADIGDPIASVSGVTGGLDLRWNTPIKGLMLGGSWADLTDTFHAHIVAYGNLPFKTQTMPEHITDGYGDYARGRWHFSGEYRNHEDIWKVITPIAPPSIVNLGSKGWFLTAAYRVNNRLEVGTYNSRFYVDVPSIPGSQYNHVFDQAVTGRFDIDKWWNVKVEGHFMDGTGDPFSTHGFYLRDNLKGFKPTTNMLVMRTGFSF
jgi:hypothetical protein